MMNEFIDSDLLKKADDSKKKADKKQQEIDSDLTMEMSTDWGRRNVYRLLEEAKVFSTTFTGNSQTFFLEGRRDIGLWKLSHIMRVCPDKYILMIQEAFYKEIKIAEAKHV